MEICKATLGGGVYKTQWMERGLTRLLEDKGLSYDVHMLNVSPFWRISCRRWRLQRQLFMMHWHNDVPVAFLNRHKGKEKALYT